MRGILKEWEKKLDRKVHNVRRSGGEVTGMGVRGEGRMKCK
jgi:hypothetical protein